MNDNSEFCHRYTGWDGRCFSIFVVWIEERCLKEPQMKLRFEKSGNRA